MSLRPASFFLPCFLLLEGGKRAAFFFYRFDWTAKQEFVDVRFHLLHCQPHPLQIRRLLSALIRHFVLDSSDSGRPVEISRNHCRCSERCTVAASTFFLRIVGKFRCALHIKKEPRLSSRLFFFVGRGERIRTSDPQHPMLVRYQAALHPVNQRVGIMVYLTLNVKGKCR